MMNNGTGMLLGRPIKSDSGWKGEWVEATADLVIIWIITQVTYEEI